MTAYAPRGTVGEAAPQNPQAGDTWDKPSTGQRSTYVDGHWVPEGVGYRHVTASTQLAVLDTLLGVNTSGGAVTITLPTAYATVGRAVVVKDEGGAAGTNPITLSPAGGATIDGQASAQITANYGSLGVYCDGTNWFKV